MRFFYWWYYLIKYIEELTERDAIFFLIYGQYESFEYLCCNLLYFCFCMPKIFRAYGNFSNIFANKIFTFITFLFNDSLNFNNFYFNTIFRHVPLRLTSRTELIVTVNQLSWVLLIFFCVCLAYILCVFCG